MFKQTQIAQAASRSSARKRYTLRKMDKAKYPGDAKILELHARGMGAKRIAVYLDCAVSTAFNWIRRAGCPKRPLPNAKLTEEAVREIRQKNMPELDREYGIQYGVSHRAIAEAREGFTWKWVK